MKIRTRIYMLLFLIAVIAAPIGAFGEAPADAPAHMDNNRIYIRLVEKIADNVDTVSDRVASALAANGWTVAGSFTPTLPDKCKYKTKVLIIHNEAYWQKIFEVSPNAKFVYPLKVNVFSNEGGTSISLVNPVALNRMIAPELETFSVETLKKLAGVFQGAVSGKNVATEEGTLLDGNRVSGIGGGVLEDNIVKVYTGKYKTEKLMSSVIKQMHYTIGRNNKGFSLVYTIDMRDKGIMFFGITKKELEKTAFTITSENRLTNRNSCPGIDHANAFPMEVVVDATGKSVKVETLRVMFRMKAYFGDTGEMAFVKHYLMPGHIEDEIVYITYPDLIQQ
ncbi:MAG: hypothetical protein HQL01_07245 [Nitrospirae bacterium]|nr:hypothetical protein [Nitrospirota bacterium]